MFRTITVAGALVIAGILAVVAVIFGQQASQNEQQAIAEAEQRATAQANAEQEREIAQQQREEAESIIRAIPDRAHTVALTREGAQPDSRVFAQRVGRWREAARDVAFVVGGAYGLDGRILKQAAERISLSSMTFPHEVARLLLLEQLYRGNTILRGEPYHKGA